ncbi:MAG TPA: DUF1684 domain-containing protein [Thermoplasmata archaeon]|nr:DUF1684 domain-containing protein [Thermoplasmata archaeon]
MGHAHAPRDYLRSIELMRREKDHAFRDDPGSPIPEALRGPFTGLAYFPPDPAYRIRVRLTRYPDAPRVVLATSKGIPRDMVRYGFFEFQIGGVAQRLDAFTSAQQPGHHHEAESLFVPFRDSTSGKESYGAARYLDVEEIADGEHVLDFNLAYNPYCAYSDAYVCPFPPRENWLSVPIPAGEKAFPMDR